MKTLSSIIKNLDSHPQQDLIRDRVSTLLEKLAEITNKANAENIDEPSYDLCSITVNGTSLFCENSLGIERKEMPQLKGAPAPSSWADTSLVKDDKGECDASNVFKTLLKDKGLAISRAVVPANWLRATQNQLVGSKVAGMTKALLDDPADLGITAPIFVSNDGYILDGHHRWAAHVGSYISNSTPLMMNVDMVNLNIIELMELANQFCNLIGLKSKSGIIEKSSMRVLATKQKTLKTLDELKDYFKKGETIKLTNIKILFVRIENNKKA